VRLLERSGRDPHRPALVLEGLARPRRAQDPHLFLEVGRSRGPVPTEELVLVPAVARAGHDREPTARREVEHGDVLGQPQRVVQGHLQGGHAHPDALRPPGHRAAEHERRRAVAVLQAVVLGQHDEVEPLLVGPGGEVEGGPVEVRRARRAPRRRAEVEADHDERHQEAP
jgi:hypothetical protein